MKKKISKRYKNLLQEKNIKRVVAIDEAITPECVYGILKLSSIV